MKFSIITINLNNKTGLELTINSVVNQTYPHIEYIVIDGGSVDGSQDLLYSRSTKIDYWISEPDSGIYNAMNKGIIMTTGDYVLFLNSGDYLINKDVIGEIKTYNPTEDIITCNCFLSKNSNRIGKIIPPNEISLFYFYNNSLPHQASLIKRSLFIQLGNYNEELKIHSDSEFFIKALINYNCSYRHINTVLTDYDYGGLSNNINYSKISICEKNQIFHKLIPKRIHYDYANWIKDKKTLKVINWIKSKPLLKSILNVSFITIENFVIQYNNLKHLR